MKGSLIASAFIAVVIGLFLLGVPIVAALVSLGIFLRFGSLSTPET